MFNFPITLIKSLLITKLLDWHETEKGPARNNTLINLCFVGVGMIRNAVSRCSRLKLVKVQYEPQHDKTNKMSVRPAKTQISLGIRPESSLCAEWVAKDPSFLYAVSKDSDKTGRMPRLIWVFAGCTAIWLVLSCRDSYSYCNDSNRVQ